jgi:hypothetical protein
VRTVAAVLALCAAAAAFVEAVAACGDDAIGSGSGAADAGLDADMEGGLDAAPVPKGSRVLGLGVDLASPDFYQNLALARDAGATTMSLSLPWDTIEREYDAGADADAAIGIYAPALHAVNLILPDARTSVAFGVPAVDETGPRLPVDLTGHAVDEDAVGARYDVVIDYVLAELVDTDVTALLVGEAVDGPLGLGDDATKWNAFATFVGRAAAHAKTKRPALKVGFTIAADTLSSKKTLAAGALSAADLVAVDYVAVDAAAQARPVEDVAADIARALADAPAGKPILFRAVGFPSAPACGGSEDAQAASVTAVFEAWDRAPDRIGTLGFYALDDLSDTAAAARAASVGRSDPAYAAMLGSLGFRSAAGQAKPALGVFRREARVRGF